VDGYWACRWIARGILKLRFGLEVAGEEHIPGRGPIILAPNHGSHIDPIVVAAAVPRRCTFLVAEGVLTTRIVGAIVRRFPFVMLKRGRSARRAIRECLTRLEHGEALIIFPEGEVSTDGGLQPANDGLAFIASRAGIPIIPVGITGTYKVWPIGTRIPHRGKITVRFGEAIPSAVSQTRGCQSAFTAGVMRVISGLSGLTASSSEDTDPTDLHAAG